jgi:solute carrier family 32 (vesicular inhibitory amino acid transporter)
MPAATKTERLALILKEEGRYSMISSWEVPQCHAWSAENGYLHYWLSSHRSSVTNRLAAMADIGGVNSFRSFARSWQRAAGFHEVIPRRPSFILSQDASGIDDPSAENDFQYSRSNIGERTTAPQTSLLRQHLEASPPDAAAPLLRHVSDTSTTTNGEQSTGTGAGRRDSEDFREREGKNLDPELASGALLSGSPSTRSSIFNNPPHLATPSIIGSYGSYRSSAYGTMGPGPQRRPRPTIGRGEAGDDETIDPEEEEDDAAHGEHEPILVKEVKQGNKVILAVEGQSTLPQSVFNSINAIIGIGILSLPLAMKLSGWLIGLPLLTLTAVVTAYTGKLLARCMDYDPTIITYSDLAYVAFGTQARIVVSSLFTLELLAANVALIILFADSLVLLLPGVGSVTNWKCICAALVLALNAVPLRFLSYTSIIGILSTFCSTSSFRYLASRAQGTQIADYRTCSCCHHYHRRPR